VVLRGKWIIENVSDMSELVEKVEKTRFLLISAGRDVDSRNRTAK
jgi:hypothetical protein